MGAEAVLKSRMDLDDRTFNSKARGIERRSDMIGRRVEGSMSKAASRIGAVFAGLFVGGALARGFKGLIGYADELDTKALELGTTMQEVQGIEIISTQNKTDLETTSKALFRMDRILGDLGNNKIAGQAFRNLNIDIERFRGLSPTERLAEMSDAMLNASDRGRAMADIYNIMGRQGQALIPILSQGSAAILQQASSIDKLSEASARSLVVAGDNLDRFAKNAKTWATEAAGSAVGLFEYLADVASSSFAEADANLANRIEQSTARAAEQADRQKEYLDTIERLETQASESLNAAQNIRSQSISKRFGESNAIELALGRGRDGGAGSRFGRLESYFDGRPTSSTPRGPLFGGGAGFDKGAADRRLEQKLLEEAATEAKETKKAIKELPAQIAAAVDVG